MATVMTSVTVNAPSIVFAATNTVTGQVLQWPAAVQAVVSAVLGSSSGQFDIGFAAVLAISSGTPYTINLSTGSDAFSNTIGMAKLGAVIVVNESVTAAQIWTVGGGTHAVMGSDQMTVQPGSSATNNGFGMIYNPAAGYTVTGSSSDTLTITNASGASVPGLLICVGR